MDRDERSYLQARSEEELQHASDATDPRAREAHLKLAHEYQVKMNIQSVTEKADNDASAITSDGDRSVTRDPDRQP